uniref:Synergin gammalike [Oreochromis niloticus] n=1 Tax=Lepeophtheirus salmonis TaxID=72036 RepID=A0A0K2UMK9_LEPSM|nr:synergin gamma-like [Lepeophtheirus salmonis]
MNNDSSSLPSIETLMMTYVDLPLNNKSNGNLMKPSSFKGPPLKDLKMPPKSSIEPLRQQNHSKLPASSLKSIDWKAFDGSSLLNTFVIDKKLSNDNASNISGANQEEEEWGEFTSSKPRVESVSVSDTKDNKDVEDDDDFSDFISLRASNLTQKPNFTSLKPSSSSHSLTITNKNLIEIPKNNNSITESQFPVFKHNDTSKETSLQGDDKYSALREIPPQNDSLRDAEFEKSQYDYINNSELQQSLHHYHQAKRSSATDFFGLSPEPLSQSICQSPIPLSTDNSDSTFNILHLQSGSSPPPEIAPTSDILGPSPLPDTMDNISFSKRLDSIYSDDVSSSSSSQAHPPMKQSTDDGISLSSNGSSSCQNQTTLQNAFILNPSSEDRYQAFREVIPSLKEENPLAKWLKLLCTCNKVLTTAGNTFNSIDDDGILNEVISSKKTSDYIVNLVEVYRVSNRIQKSFRHVEEIDASVEMYGKIKEEFDGIDKAWCSLLMKVKTKETEDYFYSSLEQGRISCRRKDYSHCGICCSYVTDYSGETAKWNNAFCKYGSRQYHSSCANLWINCVEITLPDL